MIKLKHITFERVALLAIALTVFFSWFKEPKVDVSGVYSSEMIEELQDLKSEIKEIRNELQIQYIALDTVKTSDGANDYIDDFRERTGNRLPPGFDAR